MKLPYGRTFLLGLGFLGVSVIWSIYNAFVPFFLSNKFHLSPFFIAFFMTLDNIAGVLVQPPVGVWSDKLRTPIGRRMPFIVVGAPLAALAFAFLPLAPILPLFVLCTSTLLISMALWRTPAVALVADVTPSPLRSQASGVVSFMGGVGGVIAYFGGAVLAEKNPAYPFWLGSVAVLAAAALLFLFVKEPKNYASDVVEVDEKQPGFLASVKEIFIDEDKSALFLVLALFCLMTGYTAVEASFSLYCVRHLGLSAADGSRLLGLTSLAFLVFALPSGTLGAKFGRRKTVMLGLLGMAALLLTLYFLPVPILAQPLVSLPVLGKVPFVGVPLSFIGVCYALIIIHPIAMMSDMTDNSRLGTYTGLYYLFTSYAAIVGPILNGWIVELRGQNYNVVMLFSPVMLLLAWALMWGVKRGESASQVERAL